MESKGASPVAYGHSLAVQRIFPRSPSKLGVAMGDSFTDPIGLGVLPDLMWPEVLAKNLRDLGCPIKVVNRGLSGDTSSNMCFRASQICQLGTPDLFICWAGANDQNQSFSTNITLTNIICLAHVAMFSATAVVDTEANLPANTANGVRYVVRRDGSANGGAAAYGALTTTITGSSTAIGNVWECRNSRGSTNGWGRVATSATTPTGCKHVIMQGMQYLNFSSGGDHGATPSTYLGIRETQQYAVSLLNGAGTYAYYNDNYTGYYNLIVSGQETQGSFVCQVADGNSHMNRVGNAYIAQFTTSLIQSIPNWITDLKL